jgi:hypothetical protein
MAAGFAALALLGDATVSLLHPDALTDHASGAGRLSELLSGVAFVAMAVALLPPTRAITRRRWLFAAAPVGLGLCGLVMVAVVVTGHEPHVAVFLVSVTLSLVGCVAAAVIGQRSGVWPWVTATGVAMVLPILFLVPFNSLVLAGVWAMVAVSTRLPRSGDGGTCHR